MFHCFQIPRSMPYSPQMPSNQPVLRPGNDENEVVLALMTTFTSLYSGTTVGTLAIAGLVIQVTFV